MHSLHNNKATSLFLIFALITTIIVSGALWTSIPLYGVLALIWFHEGRKMPSWEWTGLLLIFVMLPLVITDIKDSSYFSPISKELDKTIFSGLKSYYIYTIKILVCFIVVSTIKPSIELKNKIWVEAAFVTILGYFWITNAYSAGGRWTFELGFGRYLPNWTAVYLFLFAMLAARWRLPLGLMVAIVLGWQTQSRNFALALGIVGMGYLLLPLWRWIIKDQMRLVIVYLTSAVVALWILEMISTKQWSGVHFFGERIFQFTADKGRLAWDMQGLREWTKSFEVFAWGYGNWPDNAPNPHHALIHTLLERGLIATMAILFFIMHETSKFAKGMEPWILGFFSLGMFLHLHFIGMFWVIFLLILRCRILKDGIEVAEDPVVEWIQKRWKNRKKSREPNIG